MKRPLIKNLLHILWEDSWGGIVSVLCVSAHRKINSVGGRVFCQQRGDAVDFFLYCKEIVLTIFAVCFLLFFWGSGFI